jgi:hypothetical protein
MENVAYLLPLLACPVGMGLMMWLMRRGNGGQAMGRMQTPAGNAPASQPNADASEDERLTQLRAQLGEVQAQQAAIAEQIARLTAEDQSGELSDRANTVPADPLPPRTVPAEEIRRSEG